MCKVLGEDVSLDVAELAPLPILRPRDCWQDNLSASAD